MQNTLNHIIELAMYWREFSQVANGWVTAEYRESDSYKSLKVKCYFAHDSSHTNVRFSYAHPNEIEVSFHNDPTIAFNSGILKDDNLNKMIEKIEHLLQRKKDLYAQKTAGELQQRKEARKTILQQELEELNQGEKQS
jgi:hypothetical protein